MISTLKPLWKEKKFTHSSTHLFTDYWSISFRSTHFVVFRLIVLISISVFRIVDALLLIIESAKLLISCIHLTSMIFLRSYDCRRLMTSIMRRFFWIVSSRIRQSYRDLKSMQRIREMNRSRMFDTISFKIASRSKSCVNAYNFAARTLRVTRLHFIDDQWTIFAWFESTRQVTYSIWEDKFRLLAKNESVNTISRSFVESSFTHLRSLIWLSICHCSRLFKIVISLNEWSIDWAATDKSKNAFDWQIDAK